MRLQLLFILVAMADCQLYPTLIQSRTVLLPSNLPPNLQYALVASEVLRAWIKNMELAGTVPFYEPSVQGPPPQMIATSLPPRPLVVHTAPPQLLSSALPQVYQTVAPQPMLAPIPLQQQYPYGYGGYGGYGGYATQKPDGPLKRFFKGAADGFMLGSMGWLG